MKACIVGAGCSGITVAKRLKESGIDYDQFDLSDDVGGNWYHANPNGLSACYQSLHIDTSKYRLAFEDYPVPEDWPDFPHHSQLAQYFRDYVDHFGLRERITFNTGVELAERCADQTWNVQLSSGEQRSYDALIVANGHHWCPNIPNEYETATPFTGIQIHSHSYDSPFQPQDMRHKRILVVGVGNSAMDIASELSQRYLASKLFVSTRHGVWVLPKYINGKPADKILTPSWIPDRIALSLARLAIKKLVGRMSSYGLPEPDHEPLSAHVSVSSEFLTRVGSGDVHIKPGIDCIEGDTVSFKDGSREPIDVIIWATGYRISFPFLKHPELQPDTHNSFPLYRRMIKPGWRNLFFVGLAQPLPTLVNFAEQQSKYIVAVLRGQHRLPDTADMEQQIVKDEKRYLGSYYPSPRHTMQVDFVKYVQDIKKDLQRSGSWQ
ncbi:MAG: flavin-containing monooxygenase [Gammaproteobacteria bacterium]